MVAEGNALRYGLESREKLKDSVREASAAGDRSGGDDVFFNESEAGVDDEVGYPAVELVVVGETGFVAPRRSSSKSASPARSAPRASDFVLPKKPPPPPLPPPPERVTAAADDEPVLRPILFERPMVLLVVRAAESADVEDGGDDEDDEDVEAADSSIVRISKRNACWALSSFRRMDCEVAQGGSCTASTTTPSSPRTPIGMR